ncbi:MAG: N-acetylmuramoyl-L-alanine amidase [Clostridia bacterium]
MPGEHVILITVNMKKPFKVTHEQSGDDTIFAFEETLNADVLVYRNSTTRQFFTFRDIFLTSRSDSDSRHYTESYSQDGLSYSIRLENARAKKLQEETLVFNDNLLNRLEINKDDTHTTITFHSTRKLIYYPNTRDYDSTITLIDPDNEKDYIVIDPGHGGLDPGAALGDRIEKGINLELSMILYRELERRGHAVYVLREEDIFIGLFERIEIANLLNARLFLSIHVNSLDDYSVNGILSQYKNDKQLANLVHQNVLNRTGARNMGIGYRNDLLLLNRAKMPILLFETGYLTNDGDWERLNDQAYLTKMAMGMADGIEEYLAGN